MRADVSGVPTYSLINAEACVALSRLPSNSVQCVVTSPPYWGLRDYGIAGACGLEPDFGSWLVRMVGIFEEVFRVLRDDGTCWVNMGDSYVGTGGQTPMRGQIFAGRRRAKENICRSGRCKPEGTFKTKDIVGQPWRLAFALQERGWYLRSDIIWHKPSPMPESVKDRPTKAHEYIFLLTKSEKYFYDFEASKEPVTGGAHTRGAGVNPKAKVAGWMAGPGAHSTKDHARAKQGLRDSTKFGRGAGWRNRQNESFSAAVKEVVETRNMRSVWTVAPQPSKDAHFATYPEKLVIPCIRAGSKAGDTILDPFNGSGTTGLVALKMNRNYVGIELNPDYVDMTRRRFSSALGFLAREA